MVLLDKLWDGVLAGPNPDRGLGKLRKVSTRAPASPPKEGDAGGESSGDGANKLRKSASVAGAPGATPPPRSRENVWPGVCKPGSKLASRSAGAGMFDEPRPNSPTVYDWLYGGETRSSHR